MILELLDIPDALPETIEEIVVGPDLPALVRELETIHGSTGAPAELPAPLLTRILSDGLIGLSEDEFQSLLRQPRSLLQVQKSVLLDGKEYWDEVLQRVGEQVTPPLKLVEPVRPWYRSPWAWTANALTGLAASVVLFMVVNNPVNRLDDADRQMREQAARNEALVRELAALKLAHPPLMPADLPEQDYAIIKTADPPDLPENDPQDLPEAPKTQISSV